MRLLGVTLSGLQRRDLEQLELFANGQRNERLGPALDAIQERYGRDAIRRAVDVPEKITHSTQRKRGE